MKKKKNIILITTHDIGRRIGVLTPDCHTPNLDNLAKTGTLFSQAFTPQSICSPARASLYTGRYPHCNGVMGLTHGAFAWDLFDNELHLAQLLRLKGYQTRLAGFQHETNRDLSMHFDKFYHPNKTAKETVDLSVTYLEEMKEEDKPFYLQIGFIEGHRRADCRHKGNEYGGFPKADSEKLKMPPFILDDEIARDELAQLDGAVTFLDEQLGRLFKEIERLKLKDETLIIFTVDHGIAFSRAKTSLYDPGIEVAMIWNGPDVPQNFIQNGMVSHIDTLPSIWEYLCLGTLEHCQGTSYWECTKNMQKNQISSLFFEMTQHNHMDIMRGIRTDKYKLIVNFVSCDAFYNATEQYFSRSTPIHPNFRDNKKPPTHPVVELYDLTKDPYEMSNLAKEYNYQHIKRELLAQLYIHLEETNDDVLNGIPTPPSWKFAMKELRAE